MDGLNKVIYGWTYDQSCLRVDDLNHSRLRVDGLNTKSPTGGQSKQKLPTKGWTTKVAYRWTVQNKVTYGWTENQSCLRVDRQPKSPTGGQSKHHCYSLANLRLIPIEFYLDKLVDWQKWLHHLSYSNCAYIDNGRNKGGNWWEEKSPLSKRRESQLHH